jgi:alpha-amylase/alpha-mannosidase (GH57 family)
MMERYLCIHGHFYQPPRENPWLETIEIQDSAYPYHDWNERITAECYAPNSASRILDGNGRIVDIVSNYARISFNFGPTLLSWMEMNTPDIYAAIIESDRLSIRWRSGHGNAIAQVYNHMIMPLANARDKRTQVIWGLRDFAYRFQRPAEGMWLPETAVDIGTLEVLAEQGVKFTLLAPRQARRIRKIGTGKWKDVSGSKVDPSMAYLQRLPSGRRIQIFFYDGPISQAVAFEKLLNRGEDFANRLLSGFSSARQWPQILNIATDGESYGHHHKFGDMALAYALHYIESNGLARLTNYGEYLEKHPPTHEVEVFENSSWSCIHGIERWRSDCGCNSGGHPGWSQSWRGPLRESLDWLRDQLAFTYENTMKGHFPDPWSARDEYVDIILDRSDENLNRFVGKHSPKSLVPEERISVLKLLEIQRHAMLMYTSCGWFFDEISGLETVQVLQYAERAIQLSGDENLERSFRGRLRVAQSNLPEHENGAVILDKFVRTAMLDLKKVAAHFAVSSIFEEYADETGIFSYTVKNEDYHKITAGRMKLASGRVLVSSKITGETETISFSVLYLGNHSVSGGVRTFLGDQEYHEMKSELTTAFEKGAFADMVRLMDQHFGMHNYSLADLFRDQQRKILEVLMEKTVEEFSETYRKLYENNRIMMSLMRETGMPVPKAFSTAADFTLNGNLREAFLEETINSEKISSIIAEITGWGLSVEAVNLEFVIRRRIEKMMNSLYREGMELSLLPGLQSVIELVRSLPLEINYWQTQNTWYKAAMKIYPEILSRSVAGDEDAARWLEAFRYVGDMLFFDVSALLSQKQEETRF